MPESPTVAVQIVNYRTRTHLERCLETVLADLVADGLTYEINLLDNDSGEPLDDLAAGLDHCTAETAPRNLGYGGGHNRLAARTEARYLWLLNPDVELAQAGTARRLLDAIEGSGRVAAVGPRLLTPRGTPQPYDHGRLKGLRAQVALRGGHSYWRSTDTRRRVAWVSGAAVLIERATFLDVGGFDEKLFLYKEEEDLCLRVRATGAEILYAPDVVVRHTGSVVAGQLRWGPESERYFIAKHLHGRRSQRLYEVLHHGLAYLRL